MAVDTESLLCVCAGFHIVILTAEFTHKDIASAVFSLVVEAMAFYALRNMEPFHYVEPTGSVENFSSFQEHFLGRDWEPKSNSALLLVFELAFDIHHRDVVFFKPWVFADQGCKDL